jgi:hypothetical protein
MKFKEFKTPSPHIVIDDFLTQEEYMSVRNEAYELLPEMTPGKMNEEKLLDPKRKNNLNLWLDNRYKDNRELSNILHVLNKRWSQEMIDKLNTTDAGIFRTYIHTNFDVSLLSAYKNDSFYKSHIDTTDGLFLTSTFMLGSGFKGGDFILGNKTIPFKDNRLIIFESHRLHSVTKIKTDENHKNWRYSIQYFASIK